MNNKLECQIYGLLLSVFHFFLNLFGRYSRFLVYRRGPKLSTSKGLCTIGPCICTSCKIDRSGHLDQKNEKRFHLPDLKKVPWTANVNSVNSPFNCEQDRRFSLIFIKSWFKAVGYLRLSRMLLGTPTTFGSNSSLFLRSNMWSLARVVPDIRLDIRLHLPDIRIYG